MDCIGTKSSLLNQYAKEPSLSSKPRVLRIKFNNSIAVLCTTTMTSTSTTQQQEEAPISDMKERHCELCNACFSSKRDRHHHLKLHHGQQVREHHHHHHHHRHYHKDKQLKASITTSDDSEIKDTSNKALIDHMRCHPESSHPISAVSVDSKPQDNLLNQVSNRSASARRCWKVLDPLIRNQEQTLTAIAREPSIKPKAARGGSQSLSRNPEKSNNSDSSSNMKQNMDDESNVVVSKHGNNIAYGSLKKVKTCDGGLPSSGTDGSDLKQVNQLVKKQIHKMSYEDWKNYISSGPRYARIVGKGSMGSGDGKQKPLIGDKKFRCKICNKSFHTHQALGGHKSSHRTVQISDVVREPWAAVCTNPSGSDKNTHQCNVCHKSFPTGQALGGHKRLHYVQPPVRAATSATTVGLEVNSRSGGGKLLDFDLNEPAPEMEDEDLCALELLVAHPSCHSINIRALNPTLGSIHVV